MFYKYCTWFKAAQYIFLLTTCRLIEETWGNSLCATCNFPLVHPKQLMMKRSGAFVFQIQIQNCQHSQILLSHENMGKCLLCTIQTLRTGKKKKKDYVQTVCSEYFISSPGSALCLSPAGTKRARKGSTKRWTSSRSLREQITKLKQKKGNESPLHLQRNGATLFAFRAPKAGE